MTTTMEVRVGALLNGLASCLCSELTVAEQESSVPKPTMCTVLPGASIAFDYCDQGGMAWSRLVSIDPVISPLPGCSVEYDITAEVGIMRCAPGLDEEGNLPTDVEQLAASMLQNFDMGVMHKVLACCSTPDSMSFQQMGAFTPVGPDGGCLGGVWSATWRTS